MHRRCTRLWPAVSPPPRTTAILTLPQAASPILARAPDPDRPRQLTQSDDLTSGVSGQKKIARSNVVPFLATIGGDTACGSERNDRQCIRLQTKDWSSAGATATDLVHVVAATGPLRKHDFVAVSYSNSESMVGVGSYYHIPARETGYRRISLMLPCSRQWHPTRSSSKP
ncbi:hypothetical protein VFPBJ_05243 [Purpureocillium lilacinum]|uniref:Uncharacterized protein n=1 Tax=Purpureocillium lilacinum TaxID=33203 RepID=A0A179GQ87_PURLI|nr:hypothetical protein VFPBJ_05243 [Purpureocillium lilacinum]